MFKYGEGHDGKRPTVRQGKKNKKIIKKKKSKKKINLPRPSQYSDDEVERKVSRHQKNSMTRIRNRTKQSTVGIDGISSPSISRETMKNDLSKLLLDKNDDISKSNNNNGNNNENDNTKIIDDNFITAPSLPQSQPPVPLLPSQQNEQQTIDHTASLNASRIGWTKHLDIDFNKTANGQRRRISGEALRVPNNGHSLSFSKRKRGLSPTLQNMMNEDDDVIRADHKNENNVQQSDNTNNTMANIDAATLNLSSFSSGSILLSETQNTDKKVNNYNNKKNNTNNKSSVQQYNTNPNVVEGLGQAIFVLPRGVIPGGASNGSTFTLLSRIHADVQWVENACKENSDFHLWDKFIALQVHGPYELVKDEAFHARSATGAYMSLPFAQVDSRWLHFYRLFLSSIRKPTLINLRQDAILMTNGILIHKMRAGDTSMTEAVVTQPRPLKSRTFKKLTKFGLDENDVLLELLMRTSTIRSLEINYSGELTKSLADLLQTNPRLETIKLNSHFPFDRLSGVAVGLSKLCKALDSNNGGTARLVSLSLLASCTNKKVREMHKQCLVHLLSVACPKCETLKTVEIIKSKRKTSPMLLPALGALVRQSATVETLKLTSCEIPNIIKKSNRGGKSKLSSINSLASAIGSSRTLRTFDLTDSSLSTLACKELCTSFYNAPVLMNVIVDQVCVPKEGRKSLMKFFADNHHINEEELMFHSNDVYTSNRKNKTKGKIRKHNVSSMHNRDRDGRMGHVNSTDYYYNGNHDDDLIDQARKASILSIVAAVGIREQQLIKLDVSNMKMNKSGATSMASAIRNCFVLTYLNVADNNIGSVGANAICQSLRRVLTLEELYIDNNNIGDSAAHAMSTFVGEANCLRIFSLAENELTNDGGSMIWSSIAKNVKMPLMSINFAGNKIDTAWCMSNAFRSSQYLESVNLSRNVLNQSSGRVFADAILPEKWGTTRALTSLDLGGNQLGVEGSTLIARAIRQSDRLRLLWLDNNKIGAAGGSAIAKALKENESITMIDISNNMLALDVKRFSLDLHAVKELAAAVKINKTLKFLYLKGNQIGLSGGKMLKESLRENKSIQAIDLKDNELPEILQNDISMLLFTNARYGSAGVKANVTIKTDGDTVEIVDNDVEMNNNSYKNLPSNDDDNDGDINTTTTNNNNKNNKMSGIRGIDANANKGTSNIRKKHVTVRSGLPSRRKKLMLADRKLQNQNRPSSPKRSTSRPTLSRPTPREKVMETLFLPGPESVVEDRLYHKIISPTNHDRALLQSPRRNRQKNDGTRRNIRHNGHNGADVNIIQEDQKNGFNSYQFEREDEFYASLVLKSRSSQNSPTRSSTTFLNNDNRNNSSRGGYKSGYTRNSKYPPQLHPTSSSSVNNSISLSSTSVIDGIDDNDVGAETNTSSFIFSSMDNDDFKTTTPLPPANDPEIYFDMDSSINSSVRSVHNVNKFAPKLLFAGGHTALEEAVKIVSRDDSTGNGDVDVDALRRAMERMRNEMAK